MKKLLMTLLLSLMAIGFVATEAEAARFGGGRSFGAQRSMARPAPQKAAPRAPGAPAAPSAAPKRGWLGPIAGLATGIGLAALFSHLGLGEEMANVAMIMLLIMAAMFIFRMLSRRTVRPELAQYAGGAGQGRFMTALPQAAGSMERSAMSADFDAEAFLRVAKLNFVRLQAANDAKNLDDIREFTTPEVFAEIKLQMDERGGAAQQTDVVQLDAALVEALTEGPQHVVSVRFEGLIREESGAAATPFDEIWVLTKPVSGERGWVIAGIQQAG